MSCQAPTCTNPGTRGWERLATQQELDDWIASGDLPPGTTEARVAKIACEDHTVDAHRRTGLHQATCSAPPATAGVCDCTPTYPEQDASFDSGFGFD